MREIILDTETTGIDPKSGHRLVEIGCVEMVNKTRTGKTFHTYLNPERDVPFEATRVHGITSEFLLDKPLFESIAGQLLEFLGEAALVIHNAQFDMKFLNAELSRINFPELPMTRAIDTLDMARKKFPGSPNNLDALCRRFAIDISGRKYHGALLDAELLSEAYIELCGGRQVTFDLSSAKPTSTQQQMVSASVTYTLGEFLPTAEELTAHASLVAKLKQPLWEGA